MRAQRRARRGFTLLELVIGSALGALVTLVAFSFVRTQSRHLGLTSQSVDMAQVGRAAMEMLVDDVHYAGAGLGPRADGSFPGIMTGSFRFGTVQFNTNATTDDLGIMLARGPYTTIAAYNATGTAEVCDVPNLASGDVALMRSEDGLAARSITIDSITSAACSLGTCVSGCKRIAYIANDVYASDSDAPLVSYAGGELAGSLESIVWFVDADPLQPLETTLRRAVFRGAAGCTARDETCGDLVAEQVEMIQFRVWAWVNATQTWSDVTAGPLEAADRLRFDVELVVRARAASDRFHDPARPALEPQLCSPSCTQRDRFERRVFRGSVEIKNSGTGR